MAGDRVGGPVSPSTVSPRALGAGVVAAVVRRPDLWWAALATAGRLAAPGWWRRPPYLPLPDADLWSFRMVTAYGTTDARPEPADVVAYLEWCRGTARSTRTHRRRHVPGPQRGVSGGAAD